MDRCTLTGADDQTAPKALFELGLKHRRVDGAPMVEWGILYSSTQQGNGRYPRFEWIEALVEAIASSPVGSRPHFALHVCGRAVADFIAGTGHVAALAQHFDRIQLNFRSDLFSINDLKRMLARNPGHTIITQHNRGNEALATTLAAHQNHAVLFDASGGRGLERRDWPVPVPGVRCGYAGGLGPDNVVEQLRRIRAVSPEKDLWIDMEGKLRDAGDRFDLGLAASVLAQVQAALSEE